MTVTSEDQEESRVGEREREGWERERRQGRGVGEKEAEYKVITEVGADMKEKRRESKVSLPLERVVSEGEKGGWKVAGLRSRCALGLLYAVWPPAPLGSAESVEAAGTPEDTPFRVVPVGRLSQCPWKGKEMADTFWEQNQQFLVKAVEAGVGRGSCQRWRPGFWLLEPVDGGATC